jgi:L-threonylcarbamoyladenylate synthase
VQKSHSKTKLLNSTPENIKIAAEALCAGDVVGIPTETVYGLAGSALNDEAIAKIFLYKSRPSFDPLIVHVAQSLNTCKKLAEAELINLKQMSQNQIKMSDKLIRSFWPGPLTIIFPKHSRISDLVTSSLPTVGIRSPAHPVAQAILKQSQLPLAAPSANQFGRISPTKAEHVLTELGEHLNLCVEGGECSVGLESTICSVGSSGEVTVFRPGGISQESLEKSLGGYFKGLHTELGLPAIASHSPIAPGLLESHYAPRKPMIRVHGLLKDTPVEEFKKTLLKKSISQEKVSVLSTYLLSADIHQNFAKFFREVNFHYLAENEMDSLTGAHNLFAKLRELDESNADLILCELPISNHGLWPAIRDRLSRASQPQ